MTHLGTVWRLLADVILRQATFPEGGDLRGREFDWDAISGDLDEGDFVRLRRATIFELWQSIALVVPAPELVGAIASSLNVASAWRQVEAALFALQVTPPPLPPPRLHASQPTHLCFLVRGARCATTTTTSSSWLHILPSAS